MKLRRWEIAVLGSLIAAIFFCVYPIYEQAALSGKLTRLHVLANSDTIEDQTVKLKVRDAVLAVSANEPVLDGKLLEKLQNAAQNAAHQAGSEDPVTVTRTHYYFDTRVYDTFSLPAGYYDAVRVVIGEGRGHNWWCVIYPPLCAGVCERDLAEIAQEAGLTKDEVALICEEDGYVIRFRLADWWGKLLHRLRE